MKKPTGKDGGLPAIKPSENVWRQDQTFYRSLVDSLNGFAYCQMIYVDGRPHDFIYLEVNPAFEKLTGLKSVAGKKVSEVIPGILESDQHLLEIYGRVAFTGKPEKFETYLKSFDLWFSVSVSSPERGYFLAIFDVISDRKRLVTELENNAEKYRSVITALGEGIVMLQADGKITACNPAAESILGLTQAQMQGRNSLDPCWRSVHPDGSPFPGEEHPSMITLRTGKPIRNVEMGVHKPSGELTWISINSEPIFGSEQSTPSAVVVSFADITKHKQAEIALRENDARLKLAMDQAQLAEWEMDAATQMFTFNDRFYALYRTTAEREGGYQMAAAVYAREFLPPDEQKLVPDDIARLLAGKHDEFTREHRIRRRDGELRHLVVRITVMRDASGRVIGTRGVNQDITARKQAELALRESEERWKFAIEGAGDGLWDWNVLTNTVFYSKRWKEMLGYTEDEIGSSLDEWSQRVHHDDFAQAMAAVKAHLAGKTTTYVSEHRVRCKDGNWKWILDRGIVILRDDAGNPLRMISTHSDITERKQSLLQRHESLGRMAGAIAHNFNNQLAAILMNLELAGNELAGNTFAAECIAEAKQAAQKSSQISTQMLTYLGQTFAKPELQDLSLVCQSQLPLLEGALPRTVRLLVNLPIPGPVISAKNIQQALTHLLTNARESDTRAGMEIHLNVRQVDAGEISSTNRFPADWQPTHPAYACLEVTDTGRGIPPGDIEKIVEPFFTTKFAGRGLGLAMVLGIVRENNGCLTVASILGQGSTFKIFLPLAAAALPPKSAPTTLAPTASSRATILVVDDETIFLKASCQVLKRFGFTVLPAASGAEAVELFQTHAAEIACVLCDLTMPQMDGWETMRALRQFSPTIPLILMSGYDEVQIMAEQHAEKPFAFLRKPYDVEKLKLTIHQAIQSRR